MVEAAVVERDMAVSKEYLEYVVDQLACVGSIEHKRMFGGIGFYFDGLFFSLIDDDTLYFKVDDQTRPRYEKARSRGFDPYKDGRPSTGYFTVPAEVLEDQDELRVWAQEAIEVARQKAGSKKTSQKTPKRDATTRSSRGASKLRKR